MKAEEPNDRPSIFIASSSEGRDVAMAVKANFDREADVDIWSENLFLLNKSNLQNLLNLSAFYDFAIFVLTPDDSATVRGKKKKTPRDNVYFELGLFMGRIGIDRSFIIADDTVDFLSDFNGIAVSRFTNRANLISAVGTACYEVRRAMDIAAKLFSFSLLPSTSLALGYCKNFLEKVQGAFKSNLPYKVYDKNERQEKINIREFNGAYPSITILLPGKLSQLTGTTFFNLTKNLKRVHVEASSREYPFYVKTEARDNNNPEFFDIPTTLLSSLETINKIFDPAFLVKDENAVRIEKREIANFKKTISMVFPDEVASKLIKFDVLQ